MPRSAIRRQTQLQAGAALLCTVAASIAAFCGPVRAAQSADSSGLEFYEKKIRPLFVQQCYKCHSATRRRSTQAGLSGIAARASSKAARPAQRSCRNTRSKACSSRPFATPIKTTNAAKAIARGAQQDLVAWVQLGAPAPVGTPKPIGLATTRPAGPQARPRNLAQPATTRLRHATMGMLNPSMVSAPAVKNAAWARRRNRSIPCWQRLEARAFCSCGCRWTHAHRRIPSSDRPAANTADPRPGRPASPVPPATLSKKSSISRPAAEAERWGHHWLDALPRYAGPQFGRNVPSVLAL